MGIRLTQASSRYCAVSNDNLETRKRDGRHNLFITEIKEQALISIMIQLDVRLTFRSIFTLTSCDCT